MRIVAVGEPKRDRDNETKKVGDRDPLIFGANGEGVTCDTPSDGQGVELLDVLAGPDVGASKTLQNRSLVVDDSVHTSVFRANKRKACAYEIIITQFRIAPTIHPMTCMVKVCLGGKWTYCASLRSRASSCACCMELNVKQVKYISGFKVSRYYQCT